MNRSTHIREVASMVIDALQDRRESFQEFVAELKSQMNVEAGQRESYPQDYETEELRYWEEQKGEMKNWGGPAKTGAVDLDTASHVMNGG